MYGLSAFALRLYVKARGYDSLRGYAKEQGLPYTVVSERVVKHLLGGLSSWVECPGESLEVENPGPFDGNDYVRWRRPADMSISR